MRYALATYCGDTISVPNTNHKQMSYLMTELTVLNIERTLDSDTGVVANEDRCALVLDYELSYEGWKENNHQIKMCSILYQHSVV